MMEFVEGVKAKETLGIAQILEGSYEGKKIRMNGANEEAVAAFLCDEIGICAIPDLIEAALDKTETVYQPQLSDILEADRLAREVVREKLN